MQNLLDANRLSAGESIPLHYAPCELTQIILQTVAELTAVYGPRFVLQTSTAIEGYWDAKALQRVVDNICSNAIKYGDIQMPITLNLSHTNNQAVLSIHNAGKALGKQEQRQLFNLFYRTVSAQKSTQPGWGIGLMIVKGIMEAHGGKVQVTSTVKTGTTFTLYLPC